MNDENKDIEIHLIGEDDTTLDFIYAEICEDHINGEYWVNYRLKAGLIEILCPEEDEEPFIWHAHDLSDDEVMANLYYLDKIFLMIFSIKGINHTRPFGHNGAIHAQETEYASSVDLDDLPYCADAFLGLVQILQNNVWDKDSIKNLIGYFYAALGLSEFEIKDLQQKREKVFVPEFGDDFFIVIDEGRLWLKNGSAPIIRYDNFEEDMIALLSNLYHAAHERGYATGHDYNLIIEGLNFLIMDPDDIRSRYLPQYEGGLLEAYKAFVDEAEVATKYDPIPSGP